MSLDSLPWAEIIPLDFKPEASKPYPVKALPKIARDAVIRFQECGQQPMAMVACSSLAAMSFATQGLANVARDKILVSPLSLNLLVIAKSGERKTSADRFFMKACYDWQRERADQRSHEIEQSAEKIRIYEIKEKGLKTAIERAIVRSGSLDGIEKMQSDLAQLQQERPQAKAHFQAIFTDVNQQTLSVRLADGHPSAALFSDEAGVIVGGNGMSRDNAIQFFGFGNMLWDGSDFRRNRMTTPDAWVRGRRFTCSMMMQPTVFRELLNIKGGQSRGTGFLARYLFAFPESTMGTRFYKEQPEQDVIAPFSDRIRELLEMPLPYVDEMTMRLNPESLPFHPDAKAVWITFHDEIERELAEAGYFSDVSDFASKCAENAARLAGVFHVFTNGPAGEISEATMRQAAAIAGWHLEEAKRQFASMDISQEMKDAHRLLDWLESKKLEQFSTADIGQNAPREMRRKERWEPALAILIDHHIVRSVNDAGTQYVIHPKAWEAA